ncbi:hypothetical protein [Paenibacillus qinlingensis]|uniref:hypothetical protein n=1 Tax=Paenibacillus qinlingensis TaxID=1837343 RepID=UPI00156505A1|nr:hypothetical protein [Paenibacillus qinlingensis]NQX60006.1 hypothetical protein [Paenibacillus qinlingensis]
MHIVWDNIEEIYYPIQGELKNGSHVLLAIECDSEIDELNRKLLSPFIDSWTYPHNGKYIEPFYLNSLTFNKEKTFEACIILKKKNREKDEFRLFCQDLILYLNTDNIHVKSWKLLLKEK